MQRRGRFEYRLLGCAAFVWDFGQVIGRSFGPRKLKNAGLGKCFVCQVQQTVNPDARLPVCPTKEGTLISRCSNRLLQLHFPGNTGALGTTQELRDLKTM